MSEPSCIAPLAAALRHIESTREGGAYPHLGGGNQRALAAAILDALPPDWCGHADLIERLRKTVSDGHDVLDDQRATIVTLRAALEQALDRMEVVWANIGSDVTADQQEVAAQNLYFGMDEIRLAIVNPEEAGG